MRAFLHNYHQCLCLVMMTYKPEILVNHSLISLPGCFTVTAVVYASSAAGAQGRTQDIRQRTSCVYFKEQKFITLAFTVDMVNS